MLSKEEIEKNNKKIADLYKTMNYLKIKIKNRNEVIEIKKETIKLLESNQDKLLSDKQKLIEKLEEDKKKWQEFHNRVPEVPEYIDYILSFLKGEKHE